MEHRIISENQLTLFAQKMREDERSPGTIENYVRHVRAFAAWMGGNPATKETAAAWKEHLLSRKYSPGTINGMLVSLNRCCTNGWRTGVSSGRGMEKRCGS